MLEPPKLSPRHAPGSRTGYGTETRVHTDIIKFTHHQRIYSHTMLHKMTKFPVVVSSAVLEIFSSSYCRITALRVCFASGELSLPSRRGHLSRANFRTSSARRPITVTGYPVTHPAGRLSIRTSLAHPCGTSLDYRTA